MTFEVGDKVRIKAKGVEWFKRAFDNAPGLADNVNALVIDVFSDTGEYGVEFEEATLPRFYFYKPNLCEKPGEGWAVAPDEIELIEA